MQNPRRVARELALKVLFQVDVGKQPPGEVLDGALDQVRLSVDGPMSQIVQDAQHALRELAARRSQELAATMSVQSTRLIKQTAQSLSNELQAFAEAAREQTRAVITSSGPNAIAQADTRLRDLLDDTTRPALRRVSTRESNYPHVLLELADLADRKAVQIIAAFAKHIPTVAATADFMQTLVHGVIARQSEIDAELGRRSTDWALDRQAAVDRNILRLAAFEILYLPDIPNGVSINEAVELAKKYSTAESGRFVNGVLGALSGGEKET